MDTEVPGGEQVDPVAEEPSVDGIVLRMLPGTQLRRLREAADVTPDQAGYAIRSSRSKVSRPETGRVGFKARDVTGLLTLYGVTGERVRPRFLSLARASYLEQRSDVEHYLEIMDHLSSEALTPDSTTRFIELTAAET